MRNLGPMELVLILLIIIVIFGAAKLPQLGKGIGEGIREFKKAARNATADEPDKEAPKDQKS